MKANYGTNGNYKVLLKGKSPAGNVLCAHTHSLRPCASANQSCVPNLMKVVLNLINSACYNCRSSDNFQVKLLHDWPCANLFYENVHG